jgi:hypothetical protein
LDVLYYGTAKGKLFRLRNAGNVASIPEQITGTNFPSGYINCITQHPKDTAKLYVVFTNYTVLSIFESSNSGATWTAISGNLEQNASGSGNGNGPSCRWLTIAQTLDSIIYFVGTSTGLYATKKIDGGQTIWTRQGATSIGTQIVTMMDHRTSDGRMVVATYGSGVFQSYVNSLDPKTGMKEVSTKEFTVYPNPVRENLFFQNLPIKEGITYEIHGLNGELLLKGTTDATASVNISDLRPGTYVLMLKGRFEGTHKLFVKQ